jgi:hypothetical protein
MSMAMTDISMWQIPRHEIETSAGGGHAAPGLAKWLGLAAAPTFVMMALWTYGSQPDMACMAMQGSSPMSGMTVMYLLMATFHAVPWLKLISNRRNGPCQAKVAL